MSARIILITGILLGVCFLPSVAASSTESEGEGIAASYEQAIREAKTKKEEALLRKKLGDYYLSQDDYTKAADEFVKALSASPSPFTRAERLQMAIALSLVDRLDDAARALRLILAENPSNRETRLQLAKVLLWSDKLDEAETEADVVLKEDPDNQEALVIKANALRWNGKTTASLPIYEQVLARGENFEARLGLASTYIDTGDKASAQKNGVLLKPLSVNQEQERKKFQDALCAMRPDQPGVQYDYYKDSDDNRVKQYALFFSTWLHDWESELRYNHIDAVDPARTERAEDVSVKTYTRRGALGAGAGLGFVRVDNSGTTIPIGHIKADLDLGWGTAGLSAARDMLTDTAQLIENKIARSGETLSLSQRLLKRLLFSESYNHSEYSDGNGADDARFGVQYAVMTGNPKIEAGYRYRYWDFRQPSESGYFDPKGFTANQFFVSLYTEKQGFFLFVEPYAGYQSFTRNGEKSSGNIAGASGSAGWNSKRCTSFEINAEGGNYAGATTAGFKYYMIGFKFSLFM
jgi:tetratricopeptide (TPR) repeat protein